jgi:hypothetical protein
LEASGRERHVSPALRAYMTTGADTGAVADVSQVEGVDRYSIFLLKF